MPDKRWKAQERRIGRLLGLKRVGPTGVHGPDLVGEHLLVQVKDRKEWPLWLREARYSVADVPGKERYGIVVLTSPLMAVDLVLMDLRDFRELLKKAGM